MKTKSGIKICILPSPKSNEPTKVKLKLLCWATLSAVTAGAGNIARQEITFTTLSYFVYDVFKRTRSPDRRGSRRYLQLVKGVEKIVGTFFLLKLCFRAGLVLLRSKDLGSEVPVVATALIIRLHQVSTLYNIVVLAP